MPESSPAARPLARLIASICLALGSVAASGAEVAVRYQLLTDFAGTETANGHIRLAVTNVSGRALTDLTLRLADSQIGRVTGPVQETQDLAAGETRRLEGEFVLDVGALATRAPLDWLVVYSDAQGFAHQAFVRGEPATLLVPDRGQPPSGSTR